MDSRWPLLATVLLAGSCCNGPLSREFESPALGLSLTYPLFWKMNHTTFDEAFRALVALDDGLSPSRAAEYQREIEAFGLQVVLDAGKRQLIPGFHEAASVRVIAVPIPSEALEADGSCDGQVAVREMLEGVIEGAREMPFVVHLGAGPELPRYPDVPAFSSTLRVEGSDLYRHTFLLLNGGFMIDVTVSWSDPDEGSLALDIARSIAVGPTGHRCVWPPSNER